jgi:hypothetical protein
VPRKTLKTAANYRSSCSPRVLKITAEIATNSRDLQLQFSAMLLFVSPRENVNIYVLIASLLNDFV